MKRKIWAAAFLIALLIGCGAEPTPIPPKRHAPSPPIRFDADILTKAIEVIFTKADIPEKLRSGTKVLIVQRQNLVLEKCANSSLYDKYPKEIDYLDYLAEHEPSALSNHCLTLREIYLTTGKEHSQMNDYIIRNSTAAELPSIETERMIQFENKQIIDAIISNDYWSEFPEVGGLLCMTLPGYSYDWKKACLYVEFSSAGLWAAGWVIFLDYEQGEWQVTKAMWTWRS